MQKKIIHPARRLSGTITVPGDKSISHRAVMLGSIASGTTQIKGFLHCDDCDYTIAAFRKMGVSIREKAGHITICGRGLRGLKKPASPIFVGESGTSMRILPGILAGQAFSSKLTGAPGLLKRPMKRIAEPLSRMRVDIRTGKDGLPPIDISGGAVHPISYRMPIPSAQVKSAILFAGLFADGNTAVTEKFKSRDHTERMMKRFGACIKISGNRVAVTGGKELRAQNITIPGDISSASFLIVAATLLKASRITIKNVNINPTRAGVIDIVKKMGGKITLKNRKNDAEPRADIHVEAGQTKGIAIIPRDIPNIIDELPIIFVLAALSKGRTVIKGASELKIKETDRIRSMADNINRMGGKMREEKGTIIIDGVERLSSARIKSYNDHRTCMAMTVAALTAEGPSTIDDTHCINKSFPEFYKILGRIQRS